MIRPSGFITVPGANQKTIDLLRFAFDNGTITVNEYRIANAMEPIFGPIGDMFKSDFDADSPTIVDESK